MNWLVKEEPSAYSFDRLMREGATCWTGVRNPLAQRHLGSIRRGDRIFYYHSGPQRAIVGIAGAAADARPDPRDPRGKAAVVDIVPIRRLSRPVPLAEIKTLKAFSGHPLLRIGRLSVMPVGDRQWAAIEKAAAGIPPTPQRGRRQRP